MNVYIDYTETIDMEKSIGEYIGAGTYTRDILPLLVGQGTNVKVIVYKDFEPKKSNEKEYLSDESMLVRTESIFETDFSDCDILFFPVANAHHLLKTRKIRKNYPDMKIYVVFHDRQHGIVRFDPFDRYFRKGINRLLPVSYAVYLMKKAAFALLWPGFVKSVDKVITVSNHSIQALNNRNLNSITYMYQSTSFEDYDIHEIHEIEDGGEYILFVSGERPEKNLARALLAYNEFYKISDSKCKLYITGIGKEKLYYIAKRLKLSHTFLDECVRSFDYVDSKELAYLYKNCRYLLFVSKGEGFGLPVLEAMQFGKTVLCSWQSSIPEVAGSIMYYVNAYDVDSILKGMLYLNDDKNLRYREELVAKKRKIIDEQIELDKYVLVNEITG